MRLTGDDRCADERGDDGENPLGAMHVPFSFTRVPEQSGLVVAMIRLGLLRRIPAPTAEPGLIWNGQPADQPLNQVATLLTRHPGPGELSQSVHAFRKG
jgi:hypothetical protein